MKAQLFLRLISAAAFCLGIGHAARVDAQVLFHDDFEVTGVNLDGTLQLWDGPGNPAVMYLTDRMSRSGRRALELKYIPGTFGASFMYKQFFPGFEQLYFRWYQRWSPGFIWEPSATKMAIFRPRGGYPQFYPEVLWGNGQLAIQAQVIAEANWDSKNFYQNKGEPVTFQPERWYCIEVFVKLNTPGQADGELAAWIDGELKLAYDGREFRGATPLAPAPSTARIDSVAVTGYYGGVTPVPQEQYSWIDDTVFSSQPIGFQMLSDDFENATTNAAGHIGGWDGPARPSEMYVAATAAHSGTRSLEMKYEPGSNGSGYMYNTFVPQEQVYLRWFQRWSPGFIWAPSGAGLVGLRPYWSYPHFYPFTFGADGHFAIQAQVLADRNWGTENFFQNVGEPVRFQPDRWYCVEVGVKLNTPGVADGVLSASIDGETKLFYAGRQFRGTAPGDPAPSTARIQALLIAGQYGPQPVPQLQYSWQDDVVASTQPVGCAHYAGTVR